MGAIWERVCKLRGPTLTDTAATYPAEVSALVFVEGIGLWPGLLTETLQEACTRMQQANAHLSPDQASYPTTHAGTLLRRRNGNDLGCRPLGASRQARRGDRARAAVSAALSERGVTLSCAHLGLGAESPQRMGLNQHYLETEC